jgi:hypothetical protein
VTEREVLDDLIAKVREMEEQLSMAHVEVTGQSLLWSRLRHLSTLALYVRAKLEKMAQAPDLPTKADDGMPRDPQSRT